VKNTAARYDHTDTLSLCLGKSIQFDDDVTIFQLQSLESHNLTLTDAVNMAQNRPVWRLLAMSGPMHS